MRNTLNLKRLLSNNINLIILTTTTAVSVLFFLSGINSWKFSYVGDEWLFYSFAKGIADGKLNVNIFDLNGVYSQNSVLVSVYQAAFLKVLGANNFAWRFSNIILIVPLSVFLYFFLKDTFGKYAAIMGTILLQSSFYLANFFKIGYPQPLFLTFFVISIYQLNRLYKKPSTLNFILSGFTLGIAFYMRIGLFYPLILWPYLFGILRKKPPLRKMFLSIFIYFLLILPGLLTVNQIILSASISKTVIDKEFKGNLEILINVARTFMSFYNNGDSSHYIDGTYLDPISFLAFLAGLVIVVFNIRKIEYLNILLTFFSMGIFLGLTSPYKTPSITRGIFIVIFGFIFAGVFFSKIKSRINNLVIASFIFIIIFLNIYQSQIGAFAKVNHQSDTSVIIKSLQEANRDNEGRKVLFLLPKDEDFNYENILVMIQAYQLSSINFEVLKKDDPSCSEISGSLVLVLQRDGPTQKTIEEIDCPKEYKFEFIVIDSAKI